MIEQILQADRLLVVDQVDKARAIYQHVVDLDPGNAIATVGLARCALADGDDALAYELAARALTIDPENDMARRMEARLSEILAVRGADVPRPPAATGPAAREMRPVVAGAGAEERSPEAEEGVSPQDGASNARESAQHGTPGGPRAASSQGGAVDARKLAASDREIPGADAEPLTRTRRSLLDRLRGR